MVVVPSACPTPAKFYFILIFYFYILFFILFLFLIFYFYYPSLVYMCVHKCKTIAATHAHTPLSPLANFPNLVITYTYIYIYPQSSFSLPTFFFTFLFLFLFLFPFSFCYVQLILPLFFTFSPYFFSSFISILY